MMQNVLIYPAGTTKACQAAARLLAHRGVPVADHVMPEATHLLLDVPSFQADGQLRGGGSPAQLLRTLPERITLIGGNIPHSYPSAIDLLKDETYVTENAAITAECAVMLAEQNVPFVLRGNPVLIVGWGRIGKHLARILKAFGAEVAVLSTSAAHRAEAASFGLCALQAQELPASIAQFRVIFNTAPALMIPRELSEKCTDCLKMDLASKPGIGGDDVIHANGLPGIHAPESSGKLIAQTILRLLQEDT